VLRESPDVVVIATGARALAARHPGIDVHGIGLGRSRGRIPGLRVLVIDEEYGFQGPRSRSFSWIEDKQVAMVTSERTIASFLGGPRAAGVREALHQRHHAPLPSGYRSHRGRTRPRRNVWSGREQEPLRSILRLRPMAVRR